MKIKKLAAVLLAAFTVAMFTGCMGQAYDPAGTVNGQDIPAGVYLAMQYSAYSEAKSKVDNADKSVLSQKVDDISARKWIQQKTDESVRRYFLVDAMCTEREITLSDENKEYLDQMESYWDMLSEDYLANGIGYDTYMRQMVNSMLDDQLFEELYAEDGERAVDDATLKARYEEQYAHVTYVQLPIKNAETDEDMTADVQKIADEMVASLNSGTDLDTAAATALQDVYALEGRDYTDDTVTSSTSSSYLTYTPEEGSAYTQEFMDTLKGQAVGDYGSYQTASNVLVYEKIPAFESDGQFDEMRGTVVRALCKEDYNAYMESLYNEYDLSYKPGATAFYRPGKIVDD